MKKVVSIVAVVFVVIGIFGIVAFETFLSSSDSDFKTVEKSGKMVIGITVCEPMNYYDENNNLIGFDTEYAQAVCEELGVEAEFKTIDWEKKEEELNLGNIDAIWSGFSDAEQLKKEVSFSNSYLNGGQCVVVSSEDAEKYTSSVDLGSCVLTVEAGSTGESAILNDTNLAKAELIIADDYKAVLSNLLSKKAQGAVIDITLADAIIGKGEYKDYVIVEGVEFPAEEYAVGFRADSDIKVEVNRATKTLAENGTMDTIAKKYGLTEYLDLD